MPGSCFFFRILSTSTCPEVATNSSASSFALPVPWAGVLRRVPRRRNRLSQTGILKLLCLTRSPRKATPTINKLNIFMNLFMNQLEHQLEHTVPTHHHEFEHSKLILRIQTQTHDYWPYSCRTLVAAVPVVICGLLPPSFFGRMPDAAARSCERERSGRNQAHKQKPVCYKPRYSRAIPVIHSDEPEATRRLRMYAGRAAPFMLHAAPTSSAEVKLIEGSAQTAEARAAANISDPSRFIRHFAQVARCAGGHVVTRGTALYNVLV